MDADGSVVAGNRRIGTERFGMPARWENDQLTIIACPAEEGGTGWATIGDTSADGSVVVGTCLAGQREGRPFRWTASTGVVFLGEPGETMRASGVSGDGKVVVGRFKLPADAGDAASQTASVWTETESFRLDVPLESSHVVNADGTVFAGVHSSRPAYNFVWTAGQEPQMLSFAGVSTIAVDMSPDGKLILLNKTEIRGLWPALWTAEGERAVPTPCTPCYVPPSCNSHCAAVGMTPDGSVVAGSNFVWDAVHGARTLSAFVRDYGWRFSEPATFTALSDDGRVLVGFLTNAANQRAGFMLTLPQNPVADVDAGSVASDAELGTLATCPFSP